MQPKKLNNKLQRIRAFLGLTQDQMADRLKILVPETSIHPGHISQFEAGKREPSLLVLLAYAKMAGVSTDHLIDDKLDLPEQLPFSHKNKEIKRMQNASKKRS
ncbi:MAG TPA: helix-turn-helix transcriptional regulator [Blastocatellia bacterium]